MTKVTYHLVSELPDTNNLVVGAIYYLTNGSSYLIGNDKKIITISNLLKVDSLPITGDDSKLYLWVNNDKFNLYSWDGDKYIPMDIPDISQLELDIEDMGYTITNLTTNILTFAERLEEVQDNLEAHEKLKASTTELGHVKIDGTTVKMNGNDQVYIDLSDLPIPIQMNSEYVISDSPTTYPVGHTITMLNSDDVGFVDLISEFNLNHNIELTSLNTRFIVQTVKNENNMTHQTAQAITNNRGSVLGTMYRFSQSIYYGFSSWYSQTHVLVGRGAPGDQGRGEGISGNLYVNSITGKVYAKAGYDKTIGYTNWTAVGPQVVNNSYSPVVNDDETVYNAYTVDQMFTNVNNELNTLAGESATHMAQIMNLNTDLSDHMMTRTSNESMGHSQADGVSITANNGIISAKTKLNRIWESDPVPANAPTWTVDFSDEPLLTDLNNYDFEIYDDGVLIFGNPITHVVDNTTKTVTFTPRTPMPRPFTITCIGRGMEFY